MHSCSSNTEEAEVQVGGQPELPSEFQASLGYSMGQPQKNKKRISMITGKEDYWFRARK